MKKLPITSIAYKYVLESFGQWMDILGYAPQSVYSMPLAAREFLHYMESKGYAQVKDIDIKHIKSHYQNLKQRSNQRQEGGLSNTYLNKHQQALKKFSDYLRQAGRHHLAELYLRTEEAG